MVLDIADHTPSKGKGHVLNGTPCFGICPCDVSPSLCRQTGRPIDEQKPVNNSKTPPTLFAAVLLAVKMFITHRISPVPGSTCHATKCLSRSSSITLVCLLCMSGIILAVCACSCFRALLAVSEILITLSNVPSLRSACRLNASVALSRFFPLFQSAARQQWPRLPVFTELPSGGGRSTSDRFYFISTAHLLLPG